MPPDFDGDSLDNDITQQLVQSILDQAHLCPLPLHVRPVYWDLDYTLRMTPLPHLVSTDQNRIERYRTVHYKMVRYSAVQFSEGQDSTKQKRREEKRNERRIVENEIVQIQNRVEQNSAAQKSTER